MIKDTIGFRMTRPMMSGSPANWCGIIALTATTPWSRKLALMVFEPALAPTRQHTRKNRSRESVTDYPREDRLVAKDRADVLL
jgi:hypothetical protein